MASRDEKNERLYRIIRGLMNKTVENGCTPGEAANAAAKVQELLQKYQISMFDVESGTYEEGCVHDHIVQDRKRRDPSHGTLLNQVARGFNCKIVLMSKIVPVTYSIIGHKSDIETVKHLVDFLYDLLTVMANIEGAKYGRRGPALYRWRLNYVVAAANEIGNRLVNIRTAPSTSGTALVVTKQAAVQAKVQEVFGNRLTKVKSNAKADVHGADAGREAGKRVQLFPSVTKGSSNERRQIGC